MRASEFVNESRQGKIKKKHADASTGAYTMRDKGGYDRTYHLNRFMMATAMADGKDTKPVDMPDASWYEKYNTAHPYTDAEHNMIHSAMKTIPTDGKEIVKRHKSREPSDTHTVSSVPDRSKLSK